MQILESSYVIFMAKIPKFAYCSMTRTPAWRLAVQATRGQLLASSSSIVTGLQAHRNSSDPYFRQDYLKELSQAYWLYYVQLGMYAVVSCLFNGAGYIASKCE